MEQVMTSEAEIEAIVLGARMVKAFADPALAQAADDVSCASTPG